MERAIQKGKLRLLWKNCLQLEKGGIYLWHRLTGMGYDRGNPSLWALAFCQHMNTSVGAPSSEILTIKAIALSALFPLRGCPISSNDCSYLHSLSLPSCAANGQRRHNSESSLRHLNLVPTVRWYPHFIIHSFLDCQTGANKPEHPQNQASLILGLYYPRNKQHQSTDYSPTGCWQSVWAGYERKFISFIAISNTLKRKHIWNAGSVPCTQTPVYSGSSMHPGADLPWGEEERKELSACTQHLSKWTADPRQSCCDILHTGFGLEDVASWSAYRSNSPHKSK